MAATAAIPMARLYAVMRRIRAFEEGLEALWRRGEVPGLLHGAQGLEAVAAAVCAHLDPQAGDAVTSTHRPDAHALALGLPPADVAAEIMGRASGLCGGRAGQMHLVAPAQGFLGANGIVGGAVPMALGAALTRQLRQPGRVVVAFLGDGALNQGAVLESINLAAVWRLPLLFVVEDNGFHEFTPADEVTAGDLAARFAACAVPVERVDGGDAGAVYEAAGRTISALRKGEGPRALIARVVRLVGHHSADAKDYRKTARATAGEPADPLARAARRMAELGLEEERKRLDREAKAVVESALAAAGAAAPADPATLPSTPIAPAESRAHPPALEGPPRRGRRMTLAEALRTGLAQAMEADETVVVMGEDVADSAFGVTRGLLARFGRARVRNTPISEAAFLGAALGAAASGLKPVVEVMFADFAAVGMDQLINQIAKWRYLTGAHRPLPIVIRMAGGAGIGAGVHHSQNFAHFFAATPGLKCLYPCAPADALRALKAALQDPEPVILLEPKALYESSGPVDTAAGALQDGQIRIWREGRDAAVIAIGPMVPAAHTAAEMLAKRGVTVRVIEPLWLAPLPLPALIAAVSDLAHVVIVDEGAALCGLADALAARIARALWRRLAGPPVTVTPPHTPVPFAPGLESAWRPDARRIAAAVAAAVGMDKEDERIS